MYSNARYVLLVEKEASFQKLNDDNILAKLGPCIMITVEQNYFILLLIRCTQ